jgi:hypothetical protein
MSFRYTYIYLADVTLGHLRGGAGERDPLVHAGQLVGRVNLLVTLPTQRCLVRAAQHRRLRRLAHVALYLHPSTLPPLSLSLSLSLPLWNLLLPLSLSLSLSLSLNESQRAENDVRFEILEIGVWYCCGSKWRSRDWKEGFKTGPVGPILREVK